MQSRLFFEDEHEGCPALSGTDIEFGKRNGLGFSTAFRNSIGEDDEFIIQVIPCFEFFVKILVAEN